MRRGKRDDRIKIDRNTSTSIMKQGSRGNSLYRLSLIRISSRALVTTTLEEYTVYSVCVSDV